MRFEARRIKDLGPGETWWIFDEKTGSFLDATFTNGFEAWDRADAMNWGRLDRNGRPN